MTTACASRIQPPGHVSLTKGTRKAAGLKSACEVPCWTSHEDVREEQRRPSLRELLLVIEAEAKRQPPQGKMQEKSFQNQAGFPQVALWCGYSPRSSSEKMWTELQSCKRQKLNLMVVFQVESQKAINIGKGHMGEFPQDWILVALGGNRDQRHTCMLCDALSSPGTPPGRQNGHHHLGALNLQQSEVGTLLFPIEAYLRSPVVCCHLDTHADPASSPEGLSSSFITFHCPL